MLKLMPVDVNCSMELSLVCMFSLDVILNSDMLIFWGGVATYMLKLMPVDVNTLMELS